MDNNKITAKTYGKVIKLPNDTDVEKYVVKMDEIKIPKNKYWYIITEKELNTEGNEVHLVKYNNEGVNANTFVSDLKKFYINSTKDEKLKQMFEQIRVVGNDKFSIIKNIPDIEITETVQENNTSVEKSKKLLSKITSDLIKLLRN